VLDNQAARGRRTIVDGSEITPPLPLMQGPADDTPRGFGSRSNYRIANCLMTARDPEQPSANGRFRVVVRV
jgi:hypothetical protein